MGDVFSWGGPFLRWKKGLLSQSVQVPSEDGFWGVKRGLSTSLEGVGPFGCCFEDDIG